MERPLAPVCLKPGAMRDGACVVTDLRCSEIRCASCRLLVLNLNH